MFPVVCQVQTWPQSLTLSSCMWSDPWEPNAGIQTLRSPQFSTSGCRWCLREGMSFYGHQKHRSPTHLLLKLSACEGQPIRRRLTFVESCSTGVFEPIHWDKGEQQLCSKTDLFHLKPESVEISWISLHFQLLDWFTVQNNLFFFLILDFGLFIHKLF